ncbi:basic proline-rich protein-like [Cricetulus griseus]|uniref:Basic proline-rich protein-like n=1 Tax=Cricetulus griseus TaxID=10029 RepID=A0A9J7K8C1_CRIGR|nr:basic proline-rich protein-like [Cricetulus griseus]
MAGPGCPPPPSRPGEGGRSGGPHGGSARGRPAPPPVTIARLHAAAAADPRRAARRPRPPPPRGAGSHPPGEERARSPSLRVQLQHGFARRSVRPPCLPFPARAPLRSRHPGGRALPAGPARSRHARPSGRSGRARLAVTKLDALLARWPPAPSR